MARLSIASAPDRSGDLRSRGQRMVRTRHKADRLGIKYLIIKRQLQGAAADTPYHHIHLTGKSCSSGVITFSSIFRCSVGISLSRLRIACDTQSVATGEQPIFRLPTVPPCLKRAISYCERSRSLIRRWACWSSNLPPSEAVALYCGAQKRDAYLIFELR